MKTSIRTRFLGALIATAALVPALVSTASAGASAEPDGLTTIPAGYDLFQTDPWNTYFDVYLPPDFFGPGCLTEYQRIDFGGVPLGTFMGHNVGDADTIVQRMQPAFDTPSTEATVDIEMVALSLRSVEPIWVQCKEDFERWDVDVTLSPSAPSQGQMTIRNDGTFDSELEVKPLLMFTRLSDGMQVPLDTAKVEGEPLVLQAHTVPYTNGCEPPALAVPGLNDGFCPSFDGGKVLTLEQSLLAQHGVYPAQSALEHFKCYKTGAKEFEDRDVTLVDQFSERLATVTERVRLCNPVRKNGELYKNKREHLVCYETSGPSQDVGVVVRNQFGTQQLMVEDPAWLCVPSQKRLPGSDYRFQFVKYPSDHFQCYNVDDFGSDIERVGPLDPVTLKDQFLKETVEVWRPYLLCAPVDKNGEGIDHPVDHLVCYKIKGEQLGTPVVVRNQFETPKTKVKALRGTELCVPSVKVTWEHLDIPPFLPS